MLPTKLLFSLLPLLASPAAGLVSPADYTIKVGALGPWGSPDDTPAYSYIDKDGSYWWQSGHALYGANDPRKWTFASGQTMDDAKTNTLVSNYVNPSNPLDSNKDTTWRCNNSPTGQIASVVNGSSYSQKNFCDIAGLWVDPDTGDWIGLVHNEFTGRPYGDGLHFDGIDLAISSDQGKTWNIRERIITSPYKTVRGDTEAFPQQTYIYGDGDPRLLADPASGYFYVWYGSRVVDKGGSWVAFYAHVARAPMSGKLSAGSWQKYYNGTWSQPGLGGKESNLVPVSASNSKGYTPPEKEYNPANPGKTAAQIAAGLTPPTSPLFVMDVSYNAYLGLWIGEPQNPDQSGNAPQEIYATDNLETQQWVKIGDTGSYTTASWYRWFLDSVTATSSAIVGKDFRAYCSFGCSGGRSSEYVNLAIESTKPASLIDTKKQYRIEADGAVLGMRGGKGASQAKWKFAPTGDGAYIIQNQSGALGVKSSGDGASTRAWGTHVTALQPNASDPAFHWWVIKNADGNSFRIINRYSGLALALSLPSSDTSTDLAETVPVRSWTAPAGGVGNGRKAASQVLNVHPV